MQLLYYSCKDLARCSLVSKPAIGDDELEPVCKCPWIGLDLVFDSRWRQVSPFLYLVGIDFWCLIADSCINIVQFVFRQSVQRRFIDELVRKAQGGVNAHFLFQFPLRGVFHALVGAWVTAARVGPETRTVVFFPRPSLQ